MLIQPSRSLAECRTRFRPGDDIPPAGGAGRVLNLCAGPTKLPELTQPVLVGKRRENFSSRLSSLLFYLPSIRFSYFREKKSSRSGLAAVALRKLGILLHRLWITKPFDRARDLQTIV
jgi:hypothetical protein